MQQSFTYGDDEYTVKTLNQWQSYLLNSKILDWVKVIGKHEGVKDPLESSDLTTRASAFVCWFLMVSVNGKPLSIPAPNYPSYKKWEAHISNNPDLFDQFNTIANEIGVRGDKASADPLVESDTTS